MEIKRIDGKNYTKTSRHKNKKLAEQKANLMRRKFSLSCRVFKAKKGYNVFTSISSILAEQYRRHPTG